MPVVGERCSTSTNMSEIVSGLNYFLTGGYWFIRKVIIEEIKKMREKSDIKFMYIKKIVR